MFGNTSITSSWGQPQQNQQQPQQPAPAFGQPAASGFGTGTSKHDQLISRAMQTKVTQERSVREALLDNNSSSHRQTPCSVASLLPTTPPLQHRVPPVLVRGERIAHREEHDLRLPQVHSALPTRHPQAQVSSGPRSQRQALGPSPQQGHQRLVAARERLEAGPPVQAPGQACLARRTIRRRPQARIRSGPEEACSVQRRPRRRRLERLLQVRRHLSFR